MKMYALILALLIAGINAAAEPLTSWNDTESRDAILAFVERVTSEGSDDYLPEAERVAVFDNDGTLWGEQPAYFQLFYAIDRVKATASEHPAWQTEEPFVSVLKGDMEGVLKGGKEGLIKLLAASHAGMTKAEFAGAVSDWFATARHPDTGRPYNEMIYQPMVEVLEYLRANGFKTYIVSGGGIDFIRVFAEEAYGIPPEQVVGSSLKSRYEVRDGKPVIVKLPELGFIDDKEGKPVAIMHHIGRRPVMAFGNSDGDFEMLEWTTAGDGARLGVYVHHTDDEREVAYDRGSHIGALERGLDEADKRGWILIDMKEDWKVIYPE